MAIQSSFKQQCPSCEAMVPIRDPKLIGRKIDCPKCKYRFVVEEPVDDVDEAEDEAPAQKGAGNKKPVNGKAAKAPGPRRADDDEDLDDSRPKKKQGGSGMLIAGIVLAAVAVIALAVGGVILLTGDDPEEKSSGGQAQNTPPPPDTPQNQEKPQAKTDNTPKPRVDDITNLLPNNTQIVVNLPLEHLLINGKVKQALLQTPGAFNEGAFKNIWGVLPSEVRRVVLTYNIEKKTVFSVMRTSTVLNEKQIVEQLKLKAESPINGFKHYTLKKPVDALSTFFFKGGEKRDKIAVHFMDQLTVVCADVSSMNQFLQEKGQPKQLSNQPAEKEESSGGGQGGGGQGGPGGNMQQQMMQQQQQMRQRGGQGGPPGGMQGGSPNAPGGRRGGGGATPPMQGPSGPGFVPPSDMQSGMTAPPSMSGGSTSGGAASASSSYMTIDPHLKAALDQAERVDKNENQNVLLSLGASTSVVTVEDAKKFMTEQSNNLAQAPDVAVKFALNAMKKELKAVAAAVIDFGESRLVANAAAAARDTDLARDWEKKINEALPGFLSESGIDLVAKNSGNNNMPNPQGGMQGGMMNGMQGGGMQGGMQGGGMQQRMQMQRQMQQQQRMQQQGMQGGGGRPGPMGPMGPMGPSGPGGPGGGTQPQTEGDKAEEKGKLGNYEIWSKEYVLAANVSLNLSPALLKQLTSAMEFGGIGLRGMMAMADRASRIHELAAAMQAYVEASGHFPRGARVRAPDSARNLDWRPDQRLSWMTEILPYLANGEYQDVKPDPDKTWYEDPTSKKAAYTVIPQFVAPIQSKDPRYFYVSYPTPGANGHTEWAATHFVGIAGVGLDAAEYAADDQATAKKRGVFGYDRETKKTDIKDGLEQTIVLIQVPPEPKSPWIAGGGSTVRGVSEDRDCVRPFVSTKYKNKDGKEVDGTFAIMADGKVRFIPATIDPKTFQAMCTIAGGDKIRNLDQVAPEVPPPEELSDEPELKAVPVPQKPAQTPPTQAAPVAPAGPTTPKAPAAPPKK